MGVQSFCLFLDTRIQQGSSLGSPLRRVANASLPEWVFKQSTPFLRSANGILIKNDTVVIQFS